LGSVFLWQNGASFDLDIPGGTPSVLRINRSAQILVSAVSPGGVSLPIGSFLLTPQ
jgi:hypothetical protein